MMIYNDDDFKILNSSRGSYILINKHGEYSNHGHFKKSRHLSMIKLIRKEVPKKKYLTRRRFIKNYKNKKIIIIIYKRGD